jgi:toxin ParE1/3/4
MAQFRLAPRAFADFVRIIDYLDSVNPSAADKLADRLEETFATLAQVPLSGESRPEFGDEIRSAVVDRYVIYYRPNREGVAIVRIIAGDRDVKRL